MSIEEALNLIRQVVANVKANLQEHQILQQALQVIESKCKEKPKKDVKETPKKDK